MDTLPTRSTVRWGDFSSWTLHSHLAGSESVDLESVDLEHQLENLSGEGLAKEGEEWKYSFEWEALQPQRMRFIEPYIFLQISGPSTAAFRAKVYAESFPKPLVLQAELVAEVRSRQIEIDSLIERAKQLSLRTGLEGMGKSTLIRDLIVADAVRQPEAPKKKLRNRTERKTQSAGE